MRSCTARSRGRDKVPQGPWDVRRHQIKFFGRLHQYFPSGSGLAMADPAWNPSQTSRVPGISIGFTNEPQLETRLLTDLGQCYRARHAPESCVRFVGRWNTFRNIKKHSFHRLHELQPIGRRYKVTAFARNPSQNSESLVGSPAGPGSPIPRFYDS